MLRFARAKTVRMATDFKKFFHIWVYYATASIMTLLEELSPIQRLAQNACYTEGWEFYQQLPMPSASDDRWAGICLWNMGRLEDARTMFTRSKRRGDTRALIGLASICRLSDSLDECESYLEFCL